jgi:hypothetical protein
MLLEECFLVFVLLLYGVQLVLRSGVLTILDLDEVDVTPSLVEVFRSVLSGVGGSTAGGWRCCAEKFKMRRMCYSFASVLKCASCA